MKFVETTCTSPIIEAKIKRFNEQLLKSVLNKMNEKHKELDERINGCCSLDVSDATLELASMGAYMDDDITMVVPLNVKCYRFYYYEKGLFTLSSGFHCAYIDKLKFSFCRYSFGSGSVLMKGYHPNKSPFNTGSRGTNLWKDQERGDDVVNDMIEWGDVCLGSMGGCNANFENIIRIIEMLMIPNQHVSNYNIPTEYRVKVEEWGV